MPATSIEPTIAELLRDPIVGLLMEHDGVTVEELMRLLDEARQRLAGSGLRPSTRGRPAGGKSPSS